MGRIEALVAVQGLLRSSWRSQVGQSNLQPLVPRHLHVAAHLLCLPPLLAQRLCGDATIWRQDVLPGMAWTWTIWELGAGRDRKRSGEDGGNVGYHFSCNLSQ